MKDADRAKHESAIRKQLESEFKAQHRRLEKGSKAWADFERRVAEILEEQLQDIYAAAAAALLLLIWTDPQRVSEAMGRLATGVKWAATRAKSVAQSLAADAKQAWEGGSPDPLPPSRAEAIAVTETTTANSEGENEAMVVVKKDDRELRLEVRWITQKDSLVCQICGPLHNKLEPEWIARFPTGPPAHPNCVLGETPVGAASVISVFRAEYNGPIVEVRCADGSSFGVTANHMLLTSEGFVPACCLNCGDDMIRCRPIKVLAGFPSSRHPDDDYHPPTAQQIVGSFSESRGMTASAVPVSPEHLHGDGMFLNGKINIVRTNGELRRHSEMLGQPAVESEFCWSDVRDGGLSCVGNFAPMFEALRDATDGGVRRLREFKALMLGQSRHANPIGLRTGPNLQPDLFQSASNRSARDAQALRHAQDAFTGFITTTKVVEINIKHVQTPVYDIETIETVYTVGAGIVSSNCRCDRVVTRRLR